ALRRSAAARGRGAGPADATRCHLRRRTHGQPRLPCRRQGAVPARPRHDPVRADDHHGHPRPDGRFARPPGRPAQRRSGHRGGPAAHPGQRGHRPERIELSVIAVALAQIRIHWARFLAIGLGIALAAGFVATTLIINSSLQTSLENAVGRSFSHADLTVIPRNDVFVGGDDVAPLLGPMPDIDGVDTASLSARTLTTGRGTSFSESSFALSPVPADAHLDSFDLVSGQRPNAPTDLVLDASTAEDLGAAIGDEIRFTVDSVPVET